MGGPGSSRWTTTITRALADNLLRLDVRALAGAHRLDPGSVTTVTWNSGSSVDMHTPHHKPACITLLYDACDPYGSRYTVQERIPLTTTPGTFGGTRY